MATPWDNLFSNAAQNNLLSSDGMLKQAMYLRRYLADRGVTDPAVVASIAGSMALGDGGDSVNIPTTTKETDPFWSHYDYWKDDLLSGRNIMQGAGFLTGVPITLATDYEMGRNPAGTIGSTIGAGLLTQGATSPQDLVLRAVAGGIGGEIVGEKVGEELGYKGYWLDVDQPGASMAKALGFDAGTSGFDKIVNITQDYIDEKLEEGLSRDEIKDEILNFGDIAISEQAPVIEDRSLMPGERMAYDDRGRITPVEAFEKATEPTTVSDFAGMFTGLTGTVSDWFGGVSDTVSTYMGDDSGMPDYSGLTETGQIDWTRYGDTSEGEEEAQSGFHDSSHNWN